MVITFNRGGPSNTGWLTWLKCNVFCGKIQMAELAWSQQKTDRPELLKPIGF
jgi:hypothetical protein